MIDVHFTGSLQQETTKRLDVLYRKHNSWLQACAYNQSKNKEITQDLVQELYIYLGEKQNPKLFYLDSFNLLYCHNFLSSRYINFIKRQNKSIHTNEWKDKPEDKYDVGEDEKLELAYDSVRNELDKLKSGKMWTSAKLYELYAYSDLTMDELSKKIGISKSTTFLNIKKIKEHLKEVIDNPFKDSYDSERK